MTKPPSVTVCFRGIPHELDLVRCRRALVWRQVEGGMENMNTLAKAAGISRSTASRFFSGRATSLAVTLRILHVLRLRFEEVARSVEEQSDTPPAAVGRSAPAAPEQGPDRRPC